VPSGRTSQLEVRHALADQVPEAVDESQRRSSSPGMMRVVAPEFLQVPVLVVEDEVLIGMMVASILEDIGFRSVTIAANSEQALRAADAHDFGLLVSDIILEHSKLNGIDIVVSLLERKPVPVVFITAHAGVGDLQRITVEASRAAVLRKPVAHRELNNAIAALTETWRTA